MSWKHEAYVDATIVALAKLGSYPARAFISDELERACCARTMLRPETAAALIAAGYRIRAEVE